MKPFETNESFKFPFLFPFSSLNLSYNCSSHKAPLGAGVNLTMFGRSYLKLRLIVNAQYKAFVEHKFSQNE